jgi:phosphopantetheine--protein transferase-like protein
MVSNDSEQLREIFAATARDCAPAAARDFTRVLYAPVSLDPEVTKRCASVLSDAEVQRADRFVLPSDGAQFLQRRAFRRYCGGLVCGAQLPLSQIEFHETDKGRPYLAGHPEIWFSFSSSRTGLLGAWSATHGVGVDLEDAGREVETIELAERFFAPAEAAAVRLATATMRRQVFFQLWSLKEAALKSIGEGLPFGLEAFQFELQPCLRLIRAPVEPRGSNEFQLHLIEVDSSSGALVIRSPH